MLIKKPGDIKSSEITDRKVYLSRRSFLRGAALARQAFALEAVGRRVSGPGRRMVLL